jgi:hypothetical protein
MLCSISGAFISTKNMKLIKELRFSTGGTQTHDVSESLDPRSRQTPTKAKRYTQPSQLRTPHNHTETRSGGWNRRSISNIINVEKAGDYDTGGLHTKHTLSTPRLVERRPHCEHRHRARRESDRIRFADWTYINNY